MSTLTSPREGVSECYRSYFNKNTVW